MLIESVMMHQSFHASGFLVAIGCTQQSAQCKLIFLNRGRKTANAITALIAHYTWVPVSEHASLCASALELLGVYALEGSGESDFDETKKALQNARV
jgi:hypothetical protein